MNSKRLMVILMIASVLASGVLLMNRMQAERSVKTVEIVADYGELEEMAEQSELSLDTWLGNFSSYGVNSVALEEDTFRSLKEAGYEIEYGVEKLVKEELDWRNALPASAIGYMETQSSEYDFIVKTKQPEVISRIDAGLARGLEADMYRKFAEAGKDTIYVINGSLEDMTYLSGGIVTDAEEKVLERPIDAYGSKLELLGLGFDAAKIKQIQANGLEVIPRPRNNAKAPWLLQKAFEKDLKTYGLRPSHIIFTGGSVLGYDPENVMALDELIQMLDRNGISTSLIEAADQLGNTEQDGIEYVVANSNYDVVRVFPVVKYIQKRFAFYNYTGAEEIENTIYRAVTERNIRSVYFRPFMQNERAYITEPEAYESMFAMLRQRLEAHGLTYGRTTGFSFNSPNLLLAWVGGLGVAVVSVWILSRLFGLRERSVYALLGLGAAGIGGALFVAPNLSVSLLGLGAALAYPTAAIVYFVETLKRAYLEDGKVDFKQLMIQAAKPLWAGILISTLGGLTIGAMLSHSSYLVEMSYFRGVKLTLAAPFILFTCVYLLVFGYKRSRAEIASGAHFYKDILELLNLNIKVAYLFIFAAAGAVGYVYIARSGHETALQPSDLEMIFRNLLEYEFLARPRTKEFLMAFPMVMATVVFARGKVRTLIYPAGLLAVIGYASIANTFSHLRTPIYLSVIRTSYSAGLGLIAGAIAVAAASVLVKLIRAYARSAAHE